MDILNSSYCHQDSVFYGGNNFGEILIYDGFIPLLQICYGDDNNPNWSIIRHSKSKRN